MLHLGPIAWDPRKASANYAKDGVTFEEARVLLTSGAECLIRIDDEHGPPEEVRWRAVGPAARGVLAVVVAETMEGTARIVSARFATPAEVRRFVRARRGRRP